MSDAAAKQTAEIQEQLEFTAKLSRWKAEEDLKIARARWREQETEKTLAFQKEQFGFVAGSPRRYVGFKFVADGVEVVTAEWTTVVSATKLAKEEVLDLIATLRGN